MHCIILRNEMTLQFFVDLLLNFSSVPVKKQKHLHQLIAFATFFVAGGVNFPSPFPVIFFFHPDGIFLGRHLRHLFVTGFIKSTFTTMFTITGITSMVLTYLVISKNFSSRACLRFESDNGDKRQFIHVPHKKFSMPFCLRATVSQKLYCARVSHEMAQFVLKMLDLSISV